MSVALIAALPREVSALVRGWERQEPATNVVVWTRGKAVVACAGMGAARVRLAVDAAMAATKVKELISVGLAGACTPALKAGDIVRAGVVIDGESGERYEIAEGHHVLVTTQSIANVQEKARLRAACFADAVDMEAAVVAKIGRERRVSFRAIKAISDAADFEIGGLNAFSTQDGQFREAAFALHAALRPAMWSRVIALGRNSNKALSSLTETLRGELDCYESRPE